MSRSQWLRGVVATVLMATGIATVSAQQPAASPVLQKKLHFEIASQPIAEALMLLGQQSGLTIMLVSAAKSDAISPAIVGDYTPTEALTKMLAATALRAEYLDSKTVSIKVAQEQTPSGTPSKEESTESKVTDKSDVAPSSHNPSEKPPKDSPEKNKKISDSIPESGKGMAQILISGSRTLNVDVTRSEDDVQPYTILTSKEIQRSGAANVEDFLKQQLTMNTVSQTNAQAFPGASGVTSSINLRGLGTNETLVLIDGRRSAGVSILGTTNQPDINGIPLSAIDRIEVLPGSASAIYGGAAVGGVVNIILKKNFHGGDFEYTYERPSNSDANQRTFSGSYGFSLFDGNTQVMIGGEYSDGRALLLGDRRQLFERGISTILENSPSDIESTAQPFYGATTNIAAAAARIRVPFGTPGATCVGTFFCVAIGIPNLTLKPQYGGAALNASITSVPPGASPGSVSSAGLLQNAGKYDVALAPGTGIFGLQSPFGSVPLTKSLFGTLRQSLPNDFQMFAEVSTTSNSSHSFDGPFSQRIFQIQTTAPTNPFQQDVQITFPSTVSAPVTSDSLTQSMTVGLLMPLVGSWRSEVDYTWSRNSYETAISGVDLTAFDADLASGALNPFVDTILYPMDVSRYLAPSYYSGDATLNDVSIRASGTLGTLPAGSPTLTVGLEHRKEGTGNANDYTFYPLTPAANSQIVYFGQSQSTNSVYAEAIVPMVAQSNHIPGVRSLDLQVAGRSEHYSITTGTAFANVLPLALQSSNPTLQHSTITYTSTNPTIGVKYEPLANVFLRLSYASAFLPPTASQLLVNPTPVPNAARITDPTTGASYLVGEITGGNSALHPQTSKTWDFGVIWEPSGGMLAGLRTDFEYYRIVQPNYITYPSAQDVVMNSAYEGRVIRDPTTGLIATVNVSALNASEYRTAGWDAKLNYQRQTMVGNFAVRAAGTYTQYDRRQFTIGSPFLDYAGYPNDGGEVKTKANAAASWEFRNWTAEWDTNYYSSYWQYETPGSPSYLKFGPNSRTLDAQGAYTIPSQIYHDLFLSYSLRSDSRSGRRSLGPISSVSVIGGVTNLFGSRPPFDAFATYYYSTYGDPRLRSYRLTVRLSF